jgi:ribosomal-protein-alanine N-acetyltransferase
MAVFSFGSFPQLQTTRLELVEFEPDLAEDIFAVRSDPVVQLYNSVPHQTLEETRRFIAEQRLKYRQQVEIIWGIRPRALNRVVGSVSIFGWDRYHRRAQLGYDLAKESWDQGLASEAIRAVLRFAFLDMDLNRVEIWTSGANQRSLRLARRLGFELEGTLRRRILEDDRAFHDCAVFGLMRDEWTA